MRHYFSTFTAIFLTAGILTAQDLEDAPKVPDAISEPGMKGELEAVYRAWQTAVEQKNFADWKKVTAPSRQIEVQNEIISQKLDFPDALFDTPLSAPSLKNLQMLDVLTRRATATIVYFGKADFRVGNPADVEDTLVVLSFLRETDRWQFDRMRVVKIPPKSDIFGLIRVGDFTFLKGPEFQPLPDLPDPPIGVSKPDFIAEIHINSVGYASTVSVNGREVGTVTNEKSKALVIGGLSVGINSVEIKTEKQKDVDLGVPDRLEIAIYGVRSITDKGERKFHYLPAPGEIPTEKRITFGIAE